jgi:hypothetical protein
MNESRRVEKLRRDHAVEDFDCGRPELNQYLIRYAWQNQMAGASLTDVGLVGHVIVGSILSRRARFCWKTLRHD